MTRSERRPRALRLAALPRRTELAPLPALRLGACPHRPEGHRRAHCVAGCRRCDPVPYRWRAVYDLFGGGRTPPADEGYAQAQRLRRAAKKIPRYRRAAYFCRRTPGRWYVEAEGGPLRLVYDDTPEEGRMAEAVFSEPVLNPPEGLRLPPEARPRIEAAGWVRLGPKEELSAVVLALHGPLALRAALRFLPARRPAEVWEGYAAPWAQVLVREMLWFRGLSANLYRGSDGLLATIWLFVTLGREPVLRAAVCATLALGAEGAAVHLLCAAARASRARGAAQARRLLADPAAEPAA